MKMSNSLFWVKEFILPKRHEEKEQLLNTCYVSGTNARCFYRHFLRLILKGGHHYTFTCCCHSEWCGGAGPGTTFPMGCLREAGCGCLWAVHGSLPPAGHMASWRCAVSGVCVTRADLTSAPDKRCVGITWCLLDLLFLPTCFLCTE